MKIGIIDIIGIPYDGTTVFKQGLGGSESAVTLMSRELAQLGFEVTVFNTCNVDHARPGTYDGVTYRPLNDLSLGHDFDVVISSRTVIPFTDPKDYAKLNDNRCWPFAEMNLYENTIKRARMRILWMHDTFCLGDNLIEELAVQNRITDIFTLSDFHLTYVANCNHGRRRNFEVLKPRLFITRNGVNLYQQEVDIAAKDRNLFVYNASVTKGMVPLVEQIWPHVKRHIPEARLKVIGGFYRFSKSSNPDEQEVKWHELANDPRNAELGIEFTGVISQREIAKILTQASCMLYPAIFPETFGISSLESLCYNTPIITCKFGALEEIAIEGACYQINYPMAPNSLFGDINVPEQIEQFVKTTVEAYRNPYLHQQKQYYCNIVKDIAGWDSVALQWKQHIYRKTGSYLPVDEYRKVTKINHRVHKVFGRRYTNPVEMEHYRAANEQEIIVVTPYYNAEQYISDCILSVAAQDYSNYKQILINDASTDDSFARARETILSLPEELHSRFILITNLENQGAVQNQIENIRAIVDNDEAIIMLLDGDDTLVNDNSIFAYYNALYDGTTEFTYGSCWSQVDNIPLISQPYPEKVKQERAYRQHKFNWILPYTHLRTFKKHLLNDIDDSAFKDSEGEWYRAGGDGAVFYSLIEAADPAQVKCLQDIVYNYNDRNPLNDYKVNGQQQTANANEISNKMPQPKKKILIAIPTAKNIEVQTFKAIYDLIVPDGYETEFQYFYGYNIDQVRNLIANWVINGYDYLFSVDSDIAFAPDTLVKLLSHNVDMVSGLYIQRKPGEHILEIYKHTPNGGTTNMPYGEIKDRGLVEVAGCGFGCVLVRREVFQAVGYPYFVYHSAIDHRHTVSEDTDFCTKARAKGYKIYADSSIQCRHIGSTEFLIDNNIPAIAAQPPEPKLFVPPRTPTITSQLEEATVTHTNTPDLDIMVRLRELGSQRLIPQQHVDFLNILKNRGVMPKVIYDIGACVLHWTNEAQRIWPEARFVCFEAMGAAEFLYQERRLEYNIGVLSDQDGKMVDFWCNEWHPGGNTYYKENEIVNPDTVNYFNEKNIRRVFTKTLDSVVLDRGFPLPDLVKMDVQGAEMDILKGAQNVIKYAQHVILECQNVEYNKGAPMDHEVIAYMKSLGFECSGKFSHNGPDGDYHFYRK